MLSQEAVKAYEKAFGRTINPLTDEERKEMEKLDRVGNKEEYHKNWNRMLELDNRAGDEADTMELFETGERIRWDPVV